MLAWVSARFPFLFLLWCVCSAAAVVAQPRIAAVGGSLQRSPAPFVKRQQAQTTVEDSDPSLSLTSGAWTTGASSSGCTQSLARSLTSGSTITLKFNGTSIAVKIVKLPNGAPYTIILDGVETAGDSQQGTEQCFEAFAQDNLSQTEHTIVLKHNGNPNLLAAGRSTVAFDSFSYTPFDPSKVPSAANIGVIVGAVVGIVALLAIIGISYWWWRLKKKNGKTEPIADKAEYQGSPAPPPAQAQTANLLGLHRHSPASHNVQPFVLQRGPDAVPGDRKYGSQTGSMYGGGSAAWMSSELPPEQYHHASGQFSPQTLPNPYSIQGHDAQYMAYDPHMYPPMGSDPNMFGARHPGLHSYPSGQQQPFGSQHSIQVPQPQRMSQWTDPMSDGQDPLLSPRESSYISSELGGASRIGAALISPPPPSYEASGSGRSSPPREKDVYSGVSYNGPPQHPQQPQAGGSSGRPLPSVPADRALTENDIDSIAKRVVQMINKGDDGGVANAQQNPAVRQAVEDLLAQQRRGG